MTTIATGLTSTSDSKYAFWPSPSGSFEKLSARSTRAVSAAAFGFPSSTGEMGAFNTFQKGTPQEHVDRRRIR